MPACSLPTAPPLLTGTASTLIGTLSYHLHLMIYTFLAACLFALCFVEFLLSFGHYPNDNSLASLKFASPKDKNTSPLS